MQGNFEKLNKQIASFMLVSLALGVPISANSVNTISTSSYTKAEIMVPKYAAPDMPVGTIKPIKSDPIAISMYAAPSRPIGDIQGKPIIMPMMKYAAPSMPIKEINPKIITPVENELIKNSPKEFKKTKDLDNSINNMERKLNKINDKGTKNIAKASNSPSRVQTGEFIYTNYGSYRTIEPISYLKTKQR